jgi:hypothetical protein
MEDILFLTSYDILTILSPILFYHHKWRFSDMESLNMAAVFPENAKNFA